TGVQTCALLICVRLRRGGAIERRLQRANDCAPLLLGRLRTIARRHQADLELANRLLPDLGLRVHVPGQPALERQVAGEVDIVVAIDAVAADEGPLLFQRIRSRLEERVSGSRSAGRDQARGTERPLHRTLPCSRAARTSRMTATIASRGGRSSFGRISDGVSSRPSASSSGVKPSRFFASRFTPASASTRMTSGFRSRTASCITVLPLSATVALGSAPASSSKRTASAGFRFEGSRK